MTADGMSAIGHGWPPHGWTRSDLLALAGIVAACVIAIVPPLRNGVVRWWRTAMQRAGFPRRKYAGWFVRTWGAYENPYLDDTENLDLSNTFVPLSFQAEGAERESLSIATTVLADREFGNLVIEGVPGSGKSTLLKAYGVGLSQAGRLPGKRMHAVPFLVQLRKLARYGDGQVDVAGYLVDEILVSGVGMDEEQARRFLRYSLTKNQALVMLDGLDEVTSDRYEAVREAVYKFIHDHSPESPSFRARVIVSCRRQNFLSMRDEWVPAIATGVCSLAPLRDSDMFSYASKLRSKFKAPGGPEGFFQAVRASGTLDLHRVPLILAMSVGLYARKDYYEIPSSIAKLYQAMIDEMLDRQRFKRDPVGSALKFHLDDKSRFLREFALRSAMRNDDFDEFSKTDLIEFARSIAGDLNAVSDPDGFVAEIIDRSGLLSDVGDRHRYVFAHRSIQEYLAAEELRRPRGSQFLIDRADHAEWRQVIQFFAAGLKQHEANAFLRRLAERNPALAGYCLAVATPSDNVATVVLDHLEPVDYVRLPALAAATMSPRVPVQRMAIHRLRQALASPDSPLSAISGEVDALLPLLSSLAGTNAADIAGLVPDVIAQLADDPRLVEPLWRCLTAPGIERSPAAGAIVKRLLALAGTPDGFAELTHQDRYTREFLTAGLRGSSYPFANGLPADHNLVTLLAWADYLDVTPTPPNRYFEAKAAGKLSGVETARRRTISIAPFRSVRAISVLLTVVSIVGGALVVAKDGPRYLLQPYGGWTLLLLLGSIGAGFVIYLIIAEILDNGSFEESGNAENAHISDKPPGGAVGFIIQFSSFFIPPLGAAIALLPLLRGSLGAYFAIASVFEFCLWMPFLQLFDKGGRHYLYRPNPFTDMYDLPECRLWVTSSASLGKRAERAPAEQSPAEPVTPGA